MCVLNVHISFDGRLLLIHMILTGIDYGIRVAIPKIDYGQTSEIDDVS